MSLVWQQPLRYQSLEYGSRVQIGTMHPINILLQPPCQDS